MYLKVRQGDTDPGGSDGKMSAYNVGGLGSIPGLGRSPGEGERLPTPVFWPGECPGLENAMDCRVHGGHKELHMSE